jgi:hypothetical protein
LDWLIDASGWLVVAVILWDAFATIVIPKTVERRVSLSSIYYNLTWRVWHRMARKMREGSFRSAILAAYAPITLLFLFLIWAGLLVVGFTLIHVGAHTLGPEATFGDTLYFSGVTFFTLGFGDMTAVHPLGRFLSVLEAGTGFAFLAIIIGYVPVLYGHFSTREHQITLLDSKAGSNPSAGELLRRHSAGNAMEDLIGLLKEWEEWSARQLEAYLSYPLLAFYRSQHDHQSWLTSLTAIMDVCSMIEMGFEGDHPWGSRLQFQAQATFAMGRHVIVDLAYLLGAAPSTNVPNRLPEASYDQLHRVLNQTGLVLRRDREPIFLARRAMYEPYCTSLASDLVVTLPAWVHEEGAIDNWQFTAWDKPQHF